MMGRFRNAPFRSIVWLAVPQSDAPIAMPASSPLASCEEYGSPATWYSSVKRGSNILRKFRWLLLPPVAMITAFRALTVTVFAVIAMTPSARNGRIGVELPGRNFGV
jgi:hypothetical protein